MDNAAGKSGRVTVLVSCVGRRIELLQAFRGAAQRLGVDLHLVGVDSDPTAPGLACVDTPVILPRVSEPSYLPALLDAIRAHDANVLVPTTDTDLLPISYARADIAALNCTPLIGEPAMIEICRDKVRTYEHLCRHGVDTPETFTPAQVRAAAQLRFPLFMKPRTGSASQWVRKLANRVDLDYYLQRIADPIVQDFVDGVEHTLDVYVGLTGAVRCVVPRARWQVRTGEVSKGVVVKDPEIMAAGKRVVETLGPSMRGLVTLQCIVTAERRIRFIEINPRFGGGAPLGIAAGADYPGWLLQELLGQQPAIAFDGFRHGMCMLRYDWSVFAELGVDLKPEIVRPSRPFPPFTP